MTNLIWTLDDEGHLTATWETPSASEAPAPRWAVRDTDRRVVRTLVRAGAASHRVRRAVLFFYFRIQTAFARRKPA